MRKLKNILLSSFVVLFGIGTFAPVAAHAKEMNGDDFGAGNEIVLKKRSRINFVHIWSSKKKGTQFKTVGHKYLAKGTHLYGFYKGTEGVYGCFYNFKKGVKITKQVWPSIYLDTKAIKVVKKYNYKYDIDYTLRTILHESDKW